MSKKIFSYSLFKEGVRQTRTIGLVGLILVGVLSIAGAICEELAPHYIAYYFLRGDPIVLQCYVFSPLMVLSLFRFLNRREALDIYYALPYKRECLHCSYFASVVFWNLLTTLSAIGIKLIFSYVFPYSLEYATLFPLGLNLFAAQVGVAACVLLAMSVTGTVFSNVMVSLLVMFLPRVGMLSFTDMISNRCVIVNIDEQYPFLSSSMNLISGIPLSYLRTLDSYQYLGSDVYGCYNNPVGGFYTLGLALVTFVLAMWLLNKRNSELCGNAAPSQLIHKVYRIGLGCMVGLVSAVVFSLSLQSGVTDKTKTLVWALILLAITALVYFLFELFTTRKSKNLLKAIPGFLLVLAINGGVVLLALGMSHGVLSTVPAVEQLDGIYFMEYGEQDHSERSYFTAQSEKVLLTSPEAKTIAVNALKNSVGMVKSGALKRGTNGQVGATNHPDHYHYQRPESYSGWVYSLVFQEGNRQYQRQVLMTWEDKWKLEELVENSEDYQKRVYTVPRGTRTKCYIPSSYEKHDFSKEQVNELYQSMAEELQSIPYETWREMAWEYGTNFRGNPVFCIKTQVRDGNKKYDMTCAINTTHFPKTVDLYLSYYNQVYPNAIEEFSHRLEGIVNESRNDYGIDYYIHYPINEENCGGYMDTIDEVRNILIHAKPYEPGSEDVLMTFQAYRFDDKHQYIEERFAVHLSVEEKYVQHYLD